MAWVLCIPGLVLRVGVRGVSVLRTFGGNAVLIVSLSTWYEPYCNVGIQVWCSQVGEEVGHRRYKTLLLPKGIVRVRTLPRPVARGLGDVVNTRYTHVME